MHIKIFFNLKTHKKRILRIVILLTKLYKQFNNFFILISSYKNISCHICNLHIRKIDKIETKIKCERIFTLIKFVSDKFR